MPKELSGSHWVCLLILGMLNKAVGEGRLGRAPNNSLGPRKKLLGVLCFHLISWYFRNYVFYPFSIPVMQFLSVF